ncbi:putative lipid II flippase FtsW [Thiofilum flexile]|uniref:putative lipid II flippase FtsW n=1 Tax=Thiofilum flexile TaxID=125627 RepID=UPI0003623421|nr:putative lipid II flippase FtsW [Thiofilum flexile]
MKHWLDSWLTYWESLNWSRYIDRELLVAVMALLAIGIIMLGSASLWVAEKQYQDAFYYLNRQLFFVGIGLVAAVAVYQVRLGFWQDLGIKLLPVALLLLVLVLTPGIGKAVNGSSRWLGFGLISLQVSELIKVIMLLYLAGYLVRHGKNLATSASYQPLAIPLAVLGVVGALLLLQPDFGSSVIIISMGLVLLFIGGLPLKRLALLFGGALAFMVPAAFMGYRGARMEAYLNPWAFAEGKGYQTVHSLMAIGDGGWFGAGLGGGVQKLFYLPEAHNDFIFAVLAEEFGFMGMLLVLALYAWLVFRAFNIGFQADKGGQHYGAYVAYGVGFWMGFQVILHIGVNLAILPPKGLTLPLMSYGGSSILITLVALALLMRVHRETQVALFGVAERKPALKPASRSRVVRQVAKTAEKAG